MGQHHVQLSPLPKWLLSTPLLGDGDWTFRQVDDGFEASATLDSKAAADVAARVRGLGFGGHPLDLQIRPGLSRSLVRAARSEDARRRRKGMPATTRKGLQMDEEGRMSWTPESLAKKIALRAKGKVVLDAGCGVGGNTVAFAAQCPRVIAVEQNRERLEMAKKNALIYGVRAKVDFVVGDALCLPEELMSAVRLIFIDPPWGKEWDRRFTPSDSFALLNAFYGQRAPHTELWAKVPSSFDSRSFPEAVVTPFFGEGEGDRQRVKFLLLSFPTLGKESG